MDNDSISNSQENTNDLINHTEEVVIGSEQGTTFPTKVGATLCNALIDTSATRSNLSPLGIVNCTFELGKTVFTNDCIVCQNLTRPLILGRDFLMKNRVTVRYSDDGKCTLKLPSRGINSYSGYNK